MSAGVPTNPPVKPATREDSGSRDSSSLATAHGLGSPAPAHLLQHQAAPSGRRAEVPGCLGSSGPERSHRWRSGSGSTSSEEKRVRARPKCCTPGDSLPSPDSHLRCCPARGIEPAKRATAGTEPLAPGLGCCSPAQPEGLPPERASMLAAAQPRAAPGFGGERVGPE